MLGTLKTLDVHVLFLLPRMKIQLKCEVSFLFKKVKCLFWSHIFSLRISAVWCQHLVLHLWCIFWTSLNFLEQNHLHTHILREAHYMNGQCLTHVCWVNKIKKKVYIKTISSSSQNTSSPVHILKVTLMTLLDKL